MHYLSTLAKLKITHTYEFPCKSLWLPSENIQKMVK